MLITFNIGATALAVFDPKEITFESKSISSSLQPDINIGISSKFSGVDAINTFFAPLDICISDSFKFWGFPVAKITMSVFSEFQSDSSAFFQLLNTVFLLFTRMLSSITFIS